jgi:hypothetical protein
MFFYYILTNSIFAIGKNWYRNLGLGIKSPRDVDVPEKLDFLNDKEEHLVKSISNHTYSLFLTTKGIISL